MDHVPARDTTVNPLPIKECFEVNLAPVQASDDGDSQTQPLKSSPKDSFKDANESISDLSLNTTIEHEEHLYFENVQPPSPIPMNPTKTRKGDTVYENLPPSNRKQGNEGFSDT